MQMLAVLPYSFTAWETGSYIALFLSVRKRNYPLIAINALFVLGHLYIGLRSATVFAFLSIFTYYGSTQARQLLLRKKAVLMGLIATASLFLYHGVVALFKLNLWDLVRDNLRTVDYYSESFFVSESFITLSVLHNVIITGFRTGVSYLLDPVYVLIPFSAAVLPRESFNSLFQPALFPWVSWMGMSNYYWAQAWSAAEWVGVALFLGLYVGGLWFGSKWLRSGSLNKRVFGVILFVPWAFFVHRNDLLSMTFFERNAALYLGIPILAGYLTDRCFGKFRRLKPVPLAYKRPYLAPVHRVAVSNSSDLGRRSKSVEPTELTR
jgi:hypothetical protein